jgi:hypothetical protein
MSGAKGLLIVWSLGLIVLGMSWGLVYAVFLEHPRLHQMGEAAAAAFVAGAAGDQASGQEALARLGQARFAYVREVDAHSHWTALGFIGCLLGLGLHEVRLRERARLRVAQAYLLGSFLFPLGVMLQIWNPGWAAKAVAGGGAAVATAALVVAAAGLFRKEPAA